MFSRRITSNKATTKQLAELLGAVDHWELGDCQSITIHNHYSMKYNPLELGLTVGDRESRVPINTELSFSTFQPATMCNSMRAEPGQGRPIFFREDKHYSS